MDKIVLLNGKELVCEKPSETDVITLFSVGGKPDPKAAMDINDVHEKFFIEHAFYFFDRAESILTDSKMFLAPVPKVGGIGTRDFDNPTLGVFLEWWLTCEVDVTHDDKGCEALTFYIAGSPLTGTNSCSCVYRDGHRGGVSFANFHSVWHTFMEINTRYNEAKGKYVAYTLEEVFDILSAMD